MKPEHQLLPAAAPRDAITGQASAWRNLLRTRGYESEIVAEHVDPELMGTAHTCKTRRQAPRSSKPMRAAFYDAAERRLAELRPEALAPLIRSLSPLL